MNKKTENSKKILEFIRNNNWVSSTEIGKYAKMTTVSAYGYLNELMHEKLILKEWQGKNTRYFYIDKMSETNKIEFIDKAISLLREDYEVMIKENEIHEILEKNFCYVNSQNWQLSYWFQAFTAWCEDPKRWFTDEKLPIELARLVSNCLDVEKFRRKSGFFDGTDSMRKILEPYTEIAIDKLLFANISQISWFGRTRIATELYYWKQNSDKFLLSNAIRSSVEMIRNFISRNEVDTVIFTPPTIARLVQFNEVLRDKLSIAQKEITVTKIKAPDRTLIAQKYTKWADRITNADSSIHIESIDNIASIKHILILDDNFTTGATMNAIAKKLRFLGYPNKITAISIAGKFHYDAIVDMDEI